MAESRWDSERMTQQHRLKPVVVERLWKSVKYERVYLHAYESVTEARVSIMQYMDWYNRSRPHSSLGKKTPDEAYAVMLPTIEQAGTGSVRISRDST
ncbi:Integrase core domain-containing protein [Nitrosospira sp. Nsp1]|nr:Integrase core domain-containing protein [Nitrosospira sp. Nsp1]